MSKQTNPAGRVDVLVERGVELCMKRLAESTHPLVIRLKEAGAVDGFTMIVKNEVSRTLKREKITDVKSLRRALRK